MIQLGESVGGVQIRSSARGCKEDGLTTTREKGEEAANEPFTFTKSHFVNSKYFGKISAVLVTVKTLPQ